MRTKSIIVKFATISCERCSCHCTVRLVVDVTVPTRDLWAGFPQDYISLLHQWYCSLGQCCESGDCRITNNITGRWLFAYMTHSMYELTDHVSHGDFSF